jgi:hypothetical protein
VKREARQNFYRQMHTAAREIYDHGARDEQTRIIKLLEDLDDEEWMGINQNFIALIKGENK